MTYTLMICIPFAVVPSDWFHRFTPLEVQHSLSVARRDTRLWLMSFIARV
jgi:hypothetical protein